MKFLGWSGDLTVEQLADCLLGFKDVNIPQEIGISTNWDDVSLTKEQVRSIRQRRRFSFFFHGNGFVCTGLASLGKRL